MCCGPVKCVVEIAMNIINLLIFLISCAMLVVGLLIETKPSLTRAALSDMLKNLERSAQLAGVTLDTSEFSAADLLFSFSVGLITVGALLGVITILGLIGVQCKLKPVLIVYFVAVLVLFLAQVVMFLIVVSGHRAFDGSVKPHLKSTITDHFTGFEGSDPASLIWNNVMIELRCCGVDGYDDFASATSWKKTINSVRYPLVTPIACCRNISMSYTCAVNPTDDTNYWKTGCYEKWWDFVLMKSAILYALAGVLLPFQAAVLVLTVISLRSGIL